MIASNPMVVFGTKNGVKMWKPMKNFNVGFLVIVVLNTC
jgi:hypothetical protein